jgi:hypothetical protein
MFIIRLLAGLCVVLAAIAFVADLTRTMNGTGPLFTTLAAHWKAISPQSLASFQQLVSKSVHPLAWDGLARVMHLPSSLLFATMGGTLAFLTRRQRRVNIFIN